MSTCIQVVTATVDDIPIQYGVLAWPLAPSGGAMTQLNALVQVPVDVDARQPRARLGIVVVVERGIPPDAVTGTAVRFMLSVTGPGASSTAIYVTADQLAQADDVNTMNAYQVGFDLDAAAPLLHPGAVVLLTLLRLAPSPPAVELTLDVNVCYASFTYRRAAV